MFSCLRMPSESCFSSLQTSVSLRTWQDWPGAAGRADCHSWSEPTMINSNHKPLFLASAKIEASTLSFICHIYGFILCNKANWKNVSNWVTSLWFIWLKGGGVHVWSGVSGWIYLELAKLAYCMEKLVHIFPGCVWTQYLETSCHWCCCITQDCLWSKTENKRLL